MKKLENRVLRLVDEKDNLDNTKVFAFKNEQGNEITLSNELYLGINDDGSRYYEVDKLKEKIVIEENQENIPERIE